MSNSFTQKTNYYIFSKFYYLTINYVQPVKSKKERL